MNYDTLIPVIRKLALEAGEKILEIYNADDFDVKVGRQPRDRSGRSS